MSLCINPKCPEPQNSDEILFCASCGSEMLLAGKYQATKLMSDKGSFGDTYEIFEQNVPKVLKILKTNKAKAIELFEREYRVLNSLSSENIAGIPRVDDFFLYAPKSQHTIHCMVMELIHGLDFEEYIQERQRPIDEKAAVSWLSQLTRILQEIHQRGIFHRDIKPSNVVLQPNGQLVLIDFGAVKEAAVLSTGQGTQIYTPGYAAPEQQQMGGASAQSDFYALGRTFVFLLTGKRPTELYDASRDLLVWRAETTGISANFLDLVDRLMHKDFHQRPANTTALFQEIANLTRTASRQPKPFAPSPPTSSPVASSVPLPAKLPTEFTMQSSTIILSPKSKRLGGLFSKKWLLPLTGAGLAVLLPLGAWLLASQQPQPVANNGNSASNLSNNKGSKVNSEANDNETFASIQEVPTGMYKFGGSTTWATTRQSQSSIDAAIKGAFPKFNIVYTDVQDREVKSVNEGRCDRKPGSNTGICWLIEGDLDFAQSSVPLAKTRYADRAQEVKLTERAVGYDALTVVVNPQLKITALTLSQLRDIYTGKTTNWSKLGGPDLPIKTFSRSEKADGTVSAFKDMVLKKGDQWEPNQIVNNTTEGLQKVKSDPNGIFFGSAKVMLTDFCGVRPLAIGKSKSNLVKPYLEPLQSTESCNQGRRNEINPAVIKSREYPLTRQIYVVVKADGSERQKAGEAYVKLLMTQQGQELLQKSGFVSVVDGK